MNSLTKGKLVLMSLLLAAIIVISFYKLVYEIQLQELATLKEQETMILSDELRIRALSSEIGLMEAELEKITEDIKLESKRFFPALIQEKLILLMDEDLLSAGISEASISYNPPGFLEVNRRRSSVESGRTGEAIRSYTAWGMSASVSFSCSYAQLLNYLKQIKDHKHAVIINNLNVSTLGDETLLCVLDLAFYSIARSHMDSDADYLEWNMPGEYGTENPFIEFTNGMESIGQTEGEGGLHSLTEADYDFFMMLKPAHLDIPTVTMGRGNDSARQTYISSENTEVESCTITISESDGKYYYSYGTSERSYPGGSRREFAPYNSEKIIIKLMSAQRTSDGDVSGIRLTVTNKTKLPLQVIIVNDDAARPRIEVNAVGTVEII